VDTTGSDGLRVAGKNQLAGVKRAKDLRSKPHLFPY